MIKNHYKSKKVRKVCPGWSEKSGWHYQRMGESQEMCIRCQWLSSKEREAYIDAQGRENTQGLIDKELLLD